MAEIVIPNLPKLNLIFPDGIFELYQQVKVGDMLSFRAISSQDATLNVTIRKQADFCTSIDIEAIESHSGVLEFDDQMWSCNIKEITSAAFLIPGADDSNSDLTKEQTSGETLPVLSTTGECKSMSDSALLQLLEPDMSNIQLQEPAPEEITQLQAEPELANHSSFSTRSVPQSTMDDNEMDTGDCTETGMAQPDEHLTDNMPENNETIVTIGELGKVTVVSNGCVQTIREAKQLTRDQLEQVELGPDTLADYELRLQTQSCDSSTSELQHNYSFPIEETEVNTETDEWTQNEDGVFVLTPERLKKMVLSKEEMKKGEHRDPNSIVMNFPILKEGDKFKCSKCGLLLLKKNYLISHMRYVHKTCMRTPLAIYTCEFCKKQFVRKSRLKEHIAHYHINSRPFACDVQGCTQTFKTQYNLRDHKRIIHYQMLRYACPKCGKQVENPNVIVRHYTSCMHAHGEEKTAEELRNPHWIPIDQLFARPPPTDKNHSPWATRLGTGRKRKPECNLPTQSSPTNEGCSAGLLPFQNTNISLEEDLELTPRKSLRLAGKDNTIYSKLVKMQIPDGYGADHADMSPDEQSDEINKESNNEDVSLLAHRFEIKEESAEMVFKVPSLLSAVGQKMYELSHDEIWRRIYGPETLNASHIAQFLQHQPSKPTLTFVRNKLRNAGFESPMCDPILSCFTKLCEDEIEDILSDHKQLLAEFLPCTSLVPTFVYLLTTDDKQNFTTILKHAGEVLLAIKENITECCLNFDEVTHQFGSIVVTQVLDQIITLCQMAYDRIGDNNPHSPEHLHAKVNYERSDNGFEIQCRLSTDGALYTVDTEEIKRRMGDPEQMSVTLLHQYLYRNKLDYKQLVKQCIDMGCELQMGNKTKIKSCFTCICEAEGKAFCRDARQLMMEYVDFERLNVAVTLSLSKDVKTTVDSVQSKFEDIRYLQPIIKRTVEQECKQYDLVTHAMGPEFINISLDFIDTFIATKSKPKRIKLKK